jgi:GNAT superfamily N-acetyltransferase
MWSRSPRRALNVRPAAPKLLSRKVTPLAYIIVPAGPSDARDIARVHVQSWRETYKGLLPQPFLNAMSEDVHARRWRTALREPGPDDVVLIAEGRDGVVGYCSAGPSRFRLPGEGEIATLYVLRAAQGAGLGRGLVQNAARALAAHGAKSLVISVLEDNARARAFYEHLGGRADEPRADRGPGGLVYEVDYRWPDIAALS